MARPKTTKKTPRSGNTTRRARAAQKQTGTAARPKKTGDKVVPEASVKIAAPVKRHRWQRTPRAERPVRPKLPNVLQISAKAYALLARNWKLILGIVLVYGLLNILLVRGLNGGVNVSELKTEFDKLSGGGLVSSLGVLASLLSSSNSNATSDAASAYQSFLVLITSLALVWSFRQMLAEKVAKLRIRDSFYKGMYPLIPVILVFLFICLQLVPMAIGGTLFSLVVSNGIAVNNLEIAFWLVVFVAMTIWSLLMITRSIFALYIVTLPDMTPLQALRSAKALVRFRRPTVLRKLLFLPILILLPLSIVLLVVIAILPVLAQWVFFALSMFILAVVHAYIYTLYRELLHE